jgi:hypothetical protein
VIWLCAVCAGPFLVPPGAFVTLDRLVPRRLPVLAHRLCLCFMLAAIRHPERQVGATGLCRSVLAHGVSRRQPRLARGMPKRASESLFRRFGPHAELLSSLGLRVVTAWLCDVAVVRLLCTPSKLIASMPRSGSTRHSSTSARSPSTSPPAPWCVRVTACSCLSPSPRAVLATLA